GAAAETDDGSAPIKRQLLPEPLDDRCGLCLLSSRDLVRRAEARPEGELSVGSVDTGDMRVGDERGRGLRGQNLAEELERVGLDEDATRREHCVLDVACPKVGDPLVDRQASLVQLA